MPGNVFMSYYAFDTLDEVPKLTESDKLWELSQKLHWASHNVNWSAARMRIDDAIGFFAVPEYYFLKEYKQEGRNVRVELYSEDERDALLGKLATLSTIFDNIVLLPGTITWRRRAARPITANRGGKQVTLDYEGLSTAPALYNGKVLARYDKVMNDGTVDSSTADTRFVPGTASPLFQVDGLKCGFEICGDFNQKNLAKATGAMTLDFEIMMSATNYHRFLQDMDGIPVRNGGYFLHVDQAPNKAKFYNGVWCVNRGAGWHGCAPDSNVFLYDPWTKDMIKPDLYAISLGSGHAISTSFPTNYTATSGTCLPGMKPFAGLKLGATLQVTKPLDPRTGRYEMTMTVSLSASGGSTSPIGNRTIHFSSKGATVQPSSASTGNDGKATAVFSCPKDQRCELKASFRGAKVVAVAEMVWIGGGNVTKISTLKELPHPEVPTFLTPIA